MAHFTADSSLGHATFDGRADAFDRRSAPPPDAADAIADAVDAAARAAGSGALLDLGAGTGALGVPMARLCHSRGVRYLGLDLSLGMLARFRPRLNSHLGAGLVRADASRTWPLRPGTIGAVFAARAAHLLGTGPFLGEVRRVTVPGGVLLLGAVRRDPDAPRATLRRQLHHLLAERGFTPRSARQRHGELSQQLATLGRAPAAPVVVASWTVTESLDQALAAWQRPGHLAGCQVPETVRRDVLDRLRLWALDRWAAGGYDDARPLHTVERFELTSIRLESAG